MSPLARLRLLAFALAGVIFVVDQWLKHYVNDVLGLDRDGETLKLLPFFDFTRTSNYGVSLGMLTADSMEMRWGLVAMTMLIALGVSFWMLRERQRWDLIPLAMVLGGALGNIRDRVRFGYVVDFADLHFGTFRPFLIFNLADAAITIGVVIILARSFLSREKPAQAEPAQPAVES